MFSWCQQQTFATRKSWMFFGYLPIQMVGHFIWIFSLWLAFSWLSAPCNSVVGGAVDNINLEVLGDVFVPLSIFMFTDCGRCRHVSLAFWYSFAKRLCVIAIEVVTCPLYCRREWLFDCSQVRQAVVIIVFNVWYVLICILIRKWSEDAGSAGMACLLMAFLVKSYICVVHGSSHWLRWVCLLSMLVRSHLLTGTQLICFIKFTWCLHPRGHNYIRIDVDMLTKCKSCTLFQSFMCCRYWPHVETLAKKGCRERDIFRGECHKTNIFFVQSCAICVTCTQKMRRVTRLILYTTHGTIERIFWTNHQNELNQKNWFTKMSHFAHR